MGDECDNPNCDCAKDLYPCPACRGTGQGGQWSWTMADGTGAAAAGQSFPITIPGNTGAAPTVSIPVPPSNAAAGYASSTYTTPACAFCGGHGKVAERRGYISKMDRRACGVGGRRKGERPKPDVKL